MPLKNVQKTLLDLRRANIVGVEVVSLRLLLHLLSLVRLLIISSTCDLAQDVFEGRQLARQLSRVLGLCHLLREVSDAGLAQFAEEIY